jgi:TonB family protein
MAIAIPRSHVRVGIDRITGVALMASLVLHGGILYAADRWGNCLCNLGKVVCPKLCDQKRLDLEIATLPPPPTKPKPRSKPTVVEAPKPKAHTAAPKRGRVVLPDEAFVKPQRPKAETTAELPVLPREVVVKASEVSAPVLATPSLFDRADSLSAGPPGEYGLGGTGRSTDPRASGTSPTSTEVAPELPAAKPKGPSSPPRVLNWTEPPYPEAARKQGAEGVVVLRVTVSSAGMPEMVTLAHSSGRQDFDETAAAHVRRTRFAPALKDGEPVTTTIIFRVRFRLVSP